MAIPIQIRRDTVANWVEVNPLLASGELAYETDTGQMKIGNGVNNWASLGYILPGLAYSSGTAAPVNPAPANGLYFQY